jgi:hypothetical protein
MPGGKGKIRPEDGKQWPKGKSGNPKGRPKKLPRLDDLLVDILGESKDDVTAIEAILKVLRSKAAKGDLKAIEMLLDRYYGKPIQSINQNNDSKVKVEVVWDNEFNENTTATASLQSGQGTEGS